MKYKEFIQNILDTRGRFTCREEYHERHHIVPKCMGGSNNEDNLIDLYAREHFIAHELLAEENPKNKGLQYAWWNMAHGTKTICQKRYKCTPEEYEQAKIAFMKFNVGKNAPMYGKKHTEETKRKISEMGKGKMVGENNPMYGKRGKDCPFYGLKRSDDTRKKLSESRKIHRSVCQYNKQGNLLKIFDTEYDACEEIGMSISSLRDCLRKPWHTAKGYYWVENIGEIKPNIIIEKPIGKKEKQVAQYSLDGFLIKVYSSIKEAQKETLCDTSQIIRVCKGLNKEAGGFLWRYLDKQIEEYIVPPTINLNNRKAVLQFDAFGDFIAKYFSIAEARNKTNICSSGISQCCNNKAKTAGGFIWKYE